MYATNLKEMVKKNEKWTDTLKRDARYCGIGTANNQIHGSKTEYHPPEDRSFAYELKENVYAYGVLDGFNGVDAVDFVDQYLLFNIYFEYLGNIENKSDSEIYNIIKSEFKRTEEALQETFMNDAAVRTDLQYSILNNEVHPNSPDFYKKKEEIQRIDEKISCGAFAVLSLLIKNKLFVANIGKTRCFLYTSSKHVIPICFEHTIYNEDEKFRITQLNAKLPGEIDIQYNDDGEEIQIIDYTRCLGDLKTKYFYNETPQFKNCTQSVLLSEPEHFSESILINRDNFLFMFMCSEALIKSVEKTGLPTEHAHEKIAELLLSKIETEQTLNSVAQSVVDEIKRAFDDCCTKPYDTREDLTLLVRIFDDIDMLRSNLQFTKANHNGGIEIELPQNDTNTNTNTNTNEDTNGTGSSQTDNETKADYYDENGNVKPYIDFQTFYDLLENNLDAKGIIESFENDLESLSDDTRL